MEHTIEKISDREVKIQVTVTKEEYGEYLKQAFEKNREYFQVQGFRKGKAPYNLVKKKYGVEALYEDADNFAINETYFKLVSENDIKAVDYPSIEIDERSEQEGMKYTATVEVLPEFDLPEFKDLEVVKHQHEFSEADVDRRLEEMREQNARLISRDENEGAENGDTVNLDFAGTVAGEAFEGGTAEGYELELGSGSFIGDFEDQLIGLKQGEEKEVVVTFPENYGVDKLNGQEATFKCKINEIKYKEIPELDDDFASEVSEFETVDELRGDLSRQMKEDYERHMEAAAEEGALTALVEKTEIEVPNSLVERQLDGMMEELDQRLASQGMNLETYYQITGSNPEQSRETMRENAVKRAKTDLVVEKALKESGLEATDDEVLNLAKDYAKQYRQPEDFAEKLMEVNREALVHDVKLKKFLKDLTGQVKFVEGEDPMAHEE